MEDNFRIEILQRLTRIETKLENGILEIQKDHEERLRKIEEYGDLTTIVNNFEKRLKTTERMGYILVGIFTAFEILVNLQKIVEFLK